MLRPNVRRRRKEEQSVETVEANLHGHTHWSDGRGSAVEALQCAVTRNLVIAITDHNSVAALEELLRWAGGDGKRLEQIGKHLVPGMEIQARGGAELLLYFWDIERAIDFFRTEIRHRLNRSNPLFEEIDCSITELAKLCRNHGGHIGIPHLAMPVYGIQHLPRSERRQLTRYLRQERDHVFVETNPHVSWIRNITAAVYARRNRLPLLATADTHDGEFASSSTTLRLAEARAGETNAARILRSLHTLKPRRRDLHLEQPPIRKSIVRFFSLLWQMGIRGVKADIRKRMAVGW